MPDRPARVVRLYGFPYDYYFLVDQDDRPIDACNVEDAEGFVRLLKAESRSAMTKKQAMCLLDYACACCEGIQELEGIVDVLQVQKDLESALPAPYMYWEAVKEALAQASEDANS